MKGVNISNKENAIVIQNPFPTLPKFLSHPHTVNGKPYRVPSGIQKEIEFNFKELINLKSRGVNLFFTNIDKINDNVVPTSSACFLRLVCAASTATSREMTSWIPAEVRECASIKRGKIIW